MVKYISVFIIFITFLMPNALCSNQVELSKIENNLYGYDYTNDTAQNRVARLEKTIYGRASTGDINKRLKKISDDISADVIGLEISPVKDTFMEDNESESADNTVNYPIVNEIEQKLFNTTYKNRDLHTRIVTIEKKLFGKIYDVDDYSTRMDRIKAEIMPEKLVERESYPDDGSYYNDEAINSMDFSEPKSNHFSMPFGQRKYTKHYNNYGNRFGNRLSGSGNLDDDLTQMEYDMFGTEFSNESTQSRIKRLNSVNKAKKSSKKYDSQKFSQHMSTAIEIGAMILMVLAMIL